MASPDLSASCEIWDSHIGGVEDAVLLRFDTISIGRQLRKFWNSLLSASLESETSKNLLRNVGTYLPIDTGSCLHDSNVYPHGFTTSFLLLQLFCLKPFMHFNFSFFFLTVDIKPRALRSIILPTVCSFVCHLTSQSRCLFYHWFIYKVVQIWPGLICI